MRRAAAMPCGEGRRVPTIPIEGLPNTSICPSAQSGRRRSASGASPSGPLRRSGMRGSPGRSVTALTSDRRVDASPLRHRRRPQIHDRQGAPLPSQPAQSDSKHVFRDPPRSDAPPESSSSWPGAAARAQRGPLLHADVRQVSSALHVEVPPGACSVGQVALAAETGRESGPKAKDSLDVAPQEHTDMCHLAPPIHRSHTDSPWPRRRHLLENAPSDQRAQGLRCPAPTVHGVPQVHRDDTHRSRQGPIDLDAPR